MCTLNVQSHLTRFNNLVVKKNTMRKRPDRDCWSEIIDYGTSSKDINEDGPDVKPINVQ